MNIPSFRNHTLFTLFCFSLLAGLWAQPAKKPLRVLFLGNSYTYVNNLPSLLANFAAAAGDSLIFDSNTIGGYTFQQHSTNTTTLAKINQGTWDFVILQEQSQRPSFPLSQVQADVFPYAKILDSLIHVANPCTKTMFYMTWGRKNGDASNCANFPPLCTYQGMDSLLRLRYTMMANDNEALLSPVGAVWRQLRKNNPTIELYQTDESHPSAAGSYAAAACFYTALFRKNPENVAYDYSLPATDAAIIRATAKAVVFDSLPSWNIGKFDVRADFSYQHSLIQPAVSFQNASTYATNYVWHFGDGDSSTQAQPIHSYPDSTALYEVVLIASHCGMSDTTRQMVQVIGSNTAISSESALSFVLFPQPAYSVVHIRSAIFEANTCEIRLYNAQGQRVLTQTASHESTQHIDISHLASGCYYVEIFSETSERLSQQLLIAR